MTRFTLVLALVAVALAVAPAQAAAAPASGEQVRPQFCGQIKGPRTDWSYPRTLARLLGLPQRFRGRTWTVVSWGTRCSEALRGTRHILRHWVKARPGTIIRGHDLRGWYCRKDAVPRGGKGSPGGSCRYLAIGRRFGFLQLGSMSIPEIKRAMTRGRLIG